MIDPATMKRRNDKYIKKRNKTAEGIPKQEDDGGLSAQTSKVLEISKVSEAPRAAHTGTPDSPITVLPTPNMPFKNQRQVLTTVQELLEESCFDFARQWLLDVLKHQDIKEAEQVELTEWSNIMAKEGKKLPKHAIQRIAGTSLTQELTATHQLRNAAVHREKVSVARMQEMLRAALNLVTIMKDDKRMAIIDQLIKMIEQNVNCLEEYQTSILDQLLVDLDDIEAKRKTLDEQKEERIEEARRKNEDNCTAFGTTLDSFLYDIKYGAPAAEIQHDINVAPPNTTNNIAITGGASLETPFSSTFTPPVPFLGRNQFEASARSPLRSEDSQSVFTSTNSVTAEISTPSTSTPARSQSISLTRNTPVFGEPTQLGAPSKSGNPTADGSPLTFAQYTTNASRNSSSTAAPTSLGDAPKTNPVPGESGDVFKFQPYETPNADGSKMQALPSNRISWLPAVESALQGTNWWLSSAKPNSSATFSPGSSWSASPAPVSGIIRRICRGTNQGTFRPKVYALSGESDEYEEWGQSINFMPAYRDFSFEVSNQTSVYTPLGYAE